MNLLFDTNIVIHLAKSLNRDLLTKTINPNKRKIYVSIVSIAEIKSIGRTNSWGNRRWDLIKEVLTEAIVLENQ